MKIALVITVKNESRLLRDNLLYHHAIGISKAFVYFDGVTDNGPQTIDNLSFVEQQDSVSSKKYQTVQFLDKFTINAEEHHTARQCLNTYDALQKCKAQQIDWLISLDADELFLASIDKPLSLEQFFKNAEYQNADIINLKPREVVARKMGYQNVMLEETVFKTQKNFRSKLDMIYQKIYNPYNENYKTVSYWLGHTMGKSAIRVLRPIIPYNVHRYTLQNGNNPKTIDMGNILHYHIYDFEDFINKFKNFKMRSNTYLSGHKIQEMKSLWIRLVNDPNYSNEFLKTYFEKNLLYTQPKLKRLEQTRFWNIFKRREQAIIKIDFASQILIKVNKQAKNQ